MGRRSGFGRVITAIARESARQQRAAVAQRKRDEVEQRRAEREMLRLEREQIKADARAEKEEKQYYLASRIEEVEDLNSDLTDKIDELNNLLQHTLKVDDTISFSSLRISDKYPDFKAPNNLDRPIAQPREEDFYKHIQQPSKLKLILPGVKTKYEKSLLQAKENFERATEKWKQEEELRLSKLEEAKKAHQKSKESFELKKKQRNDDIDELEESYKNNDPDTILTYNNMVLERSDYPDGFPQEFRLAYLSDSKQLVIEYELPSVDIIPSAEEYRYVKTKDEITEKSRKATDIKALYQDIVSAIALRTIHEVFEADQITCLDVVCFNGFIQTIDTATGKDIRPHIISVRTTRDKFLDIDLSRVDKKACLRNLGAQVSPRPAEAQPVKPVVDFDMVDKRFVDQSDVLTDLESRPNLMDLNPFEFEHLVANLFGQMGLESKLTRSSKDGGVDCVAFDPRPILGGKVVIQAKRYSNTVGVSAVRDLYGTMMNEGANKGILVSTSSYGPDAYEFCKDKPVELIDGGGLLYLLQQMGTEARIIFHNK